MPAQEQPKPEPVKKPSATSTNVIEGQLFTDTGESLAAAKEEEERKRQQEKEAIIAKQKAEKEAQRMAEEERRAAEEAEKKRKIDCEELIQEAIRLKNNEKYSDALKRLKKAEAMNISEKVETIKNIKNEIEELKSKNSITSRLTSWINNILDEDNN